MTLEMPNYYDMRDRMLWDELEKASSERELTPTEHRFCVSMYHMEEYASGLDGDREPLWGSREDYYEEGEEDDEIEY